MGVSIVMAIGSFLALGMFSMLDLKDAEAKT
jgi:hypothetical protein